MREPLAPILLKKKRVPQRERTLEDVLNAFVGVLDNDTPVKTRRRYIGGHQHHHLSRPAVETILQEMIASFVSSIKAPLSETIPPPSLDHKRHVVQAFARSHSAKELPRLILAFASSLQQHQQQQHKSHRQHQFTTVVVLQKLLHFLGRCNVPGVVVTPRQRSHLQIVCRRLLPLTAAKDHPHHREREDGCHDSSSSNNNREESLFKHSVPLAGIQLRTPSGAAADMEEAATKILHHLRVLKKGGYWQHLPAEAPYPATTTRMEEDDDDGSDNGGAFANAPTGRIHSESNITKDRMVLDKENTSHFSNRKRPRVYPNENDQDVDDHDDDDDGSDGEDDDEFDASDQLDGANNAYCSCVLKASNDGIIIQRVTDDGWILSSPGNSMERDWHLLRLPPRVASLGLESTIIVGMDLAKRCDNGALEPCDEQRDALQ